MPCESCNVQFTIFKHKKSCSECRRLFCLNCLEKCRKRTLCSRCVIFNKRPLTRIELQRLKAKDLIVYLQSKHISTANCLEKDDLVNLVLAHVDSLTGGGSPTSNSSGSIPSPGSQFEGFRSYLNNLTSPTATQPTTQSTRGNPTPPHQPQPRRPSRESFAAENPFAFLRQGCQTILENVSDKLATNFNFDPSQASTSSRSSNTPTSSATSPLAATQRSTPGRPTQRAPPPPPPRSPPPASTTRSRDASDGPNTSRPKPKVPLVESLLTHTESGCECSEDEESKHQRTTSQSTSNLLDTPLDELIALPGTSGCNNTRHQKRIPFSKSKATTLSESSEFSSYEELNVVTVGQSQTNPIKPAAPEREWSNRVITRRRSDGCLSEQMLEFGNIPRDRSVNNGLKKNCCGRCGRKKNELERRLKRFHGQLTALSTQDVEVRQHLEAILSYLEKRQRRSVQSEEESTSEPVIVDQPAPREEPMPEEITQPQEEAGEDDQKPEKVMYRRRFVQLDEIKSSSDLEEFSVKQLKEILVLNRVDFKGCCEKKELIERVKRLLDDYHATPAVEKLQFDDLCKICMDAPIECVILECGHMATCTNCGKVLNECPICRQFVIRVVRFFRA